jgi:hypothetical protein
MGISIVLERPSALLFQCAPVIRHNAVNENDAAKSE